MGAAPWPARPERRWLPALLAVAAGAVLGSALWLAWSLRRPEPARPVTSAVAVPSATPVPAAASAGPTGSTLEGAPPVSLPAAAARPPRANEAPPATPRPPVVKPSADSDAAAGLQLQAISERDGKPVAILNDHLVHEGDRFDGITVLRIGADEVEIEVQGRRRTLRF